MDLTAGKVCQEEFRQRVINPGKAVTAEQLMQDISKVLSSCSQGKKKLNLHASYAIIDDGSDRDAIRPEHFARWVEFAKKYNMGIDFNPTFFSHRMVKNGLTLSSPDDEVRKFWIETWKKVYRDIRVLC